MRHPGQLKTLRSLLNRSGTHLETLKLEANIQVQRGSMIDQLLGPELKEKVTTGDLKSGLLTLYVSDSGLSSRLRFMETSLIHSLQSESLFRGLRRIQLRVRPKTKNPSKKLASKIVPNPEAGKNLQQFSTTIADPELKRQFQKLAARVSGNLWLDQT
ncbi:DUF721 domain-containing protein [Litorivicinus sp.]|nr:DUF721 domain-containing protein [Litorivicinus sp.]